jgi:hypothetical protein
MQTRGEYQDGRPHGRWEAWDEDGSLNPQRSGVFEAGERKSGLDG